MPCKSRSSAGCRAGLGPGRRGLEPTDSRSSVAASNEEARQKAATSCVDVLFISFSDVFLEDQKPDMVWHHVTKQDAPKKPSVSEMNAHNSGLTLPGLLHPWRFRRRQGE